MHVARSLPRLVPCVIVGAALAAIAAAQQPPPNVRFLEGHKSPIYAVAYAPDGKTLLTGGTDGSILAWDVESGELIRATRDSAQPVLALAVAPDGLRFSAAGLDGKLRTYDVPMRGPLQTGSGFPDDPTAAAVSADGTLFFTGDRSRLVRLWNLSNGAPLRDYGGSTGVITALALAPDKQHVLASAADGSIRAWIVENAQPAGLLQTAAGNITTFHAPSGLLASGGSDGILRLFQWPAAPMKPLAAHGAAVPGVAISPDGRLAVSGSADQTVRLLDVMEGKELKHLPAGAPVTAVAMRGGDAPLAVAATAAGFVKLLNAAPGDKLGEPLGDLAGHEGPIQAIAFHPDGKQLATVGQDGTLRIWRLPAPLRTWEGHTQAVLSLAVAADGKSAVTASADNTLAVWNIADGQRALVITEPWHQPRTVAISANGQLVASGDAAGTVRLFARETGSLLAALLAHTGPVQRLAFRGDGKALFSAGADGLVKTWALPPAAPLVAQGHRAAVRAVALSRNGKLLASGGDDQSLRIVQAADGQLIKAIENLGAAVTATAFDPKAEIIAAGIANGQVRLWKTDGTELPALVGHTGAVASAAFHPTERQLATAGQDGTVRLWDFPVAPTPFRGHEGAVTTVAALPGGNVLLTGSADKTARLWNIPDGKLLHTLVGHAHPLCASAARPDGHLLATGDAQGWVRLWTPDGKSAGELGAHDGAVAGIVLHANNTLAATAGGDGLLRLWQLPVLPGKAIDQGGAVAAVVLSPDGRQAFAAIDKDVRLIDLAGGTVQRQFAGATARIRALALSANAQMLAAADDAGKLSFWNVADAKHLGTIEAHAGPATAVALHPGGQQALSAGRDGALCIWSLPPAENPLVRKITGHEAAIHGLALTADGNQALTAGEDKTVRLWNLADGAQVRVYGGHQAAILSVVLTKENKVVAGGADKTVRIWNFADAAAGPILVHPAPVRSVTATGDGTRLITCGDDGLVRVWQTASGLQLQHYPAGAVPVLCAASLDGKTVVFGGGNALHVESVAALAAIRASEMPLTDVAVLPDGQHYVTAGDDRLVKLWNAAGQMTRQFADCTAAVRCLALRGDGQFLAAGSADHSVYVWNLASGALQFKWTAPAAITDVAFSPDHARLCIGAADQRLRFLDVSTGKLLEEIAAGALPASLCFGADARTLFTTGPENAALAVRGALVRVFSGHEGPATSVAFVADKQLVSGGNDKSVRLWNLADGQPIRNFGGCTDVVTSVAASTDGNRVAAACADRNLRVWNVADAALVATLVHPVPVRSASLSADGTRAASGADDSLVRVWDVASAKELQSLGGHSGAVLATDLSPDGATVVSGGDTTVGRSIVSAAHLIVAHPGKVNDVTPLADGSLLTAGDDHLVKLWDKDGKLVRQFAGLNMPVLRVVASSDGQTLAAGGDPALSARDVVLWKLADGSTLARATLPAAVTGLSFRGDRLAAGGADGLLRLLRGSDLKLLESAALPGAVTDVALVPDGQVLAAGADGKTRAWTPSLAALLTGHDGAVTAVAFAPNGTVISGGADKTVRVWHVREQTSLMQLAADRNFRWWKLADGAPAGSVELPANPRSLAFVRPNWLAVGADDLQVRIFDLSLKSGSIAAALVQQFAETNVPLGLAAPADGKLLLTGTADSAVRKWSLAAVAAAQAHEGPIHALAFSSDGKTLFTAGDDKRAAAWHAADLRNAAHFAGAQAPLRALAVDEAARLLYAGGDDQHLRAWNLADGAAVLDLAGPAKISSLAPIADGSGLVAAGADGVWRNYAVRWADGKLELAVVQEGRVPAPPGAAPPGPPAAPLAALALAGDGRTLFSISADRAWRKWFVASSQVRAAWDAHKTAVHAVAYHKDGTRLAAASSDGTAVIWDAATGKPLAACSGHEGPVLSVCFKADGTQLATCGLDKTVRIWDLEGKPLKVLNQGISAGLHALAWAPGGRYLVAGGRSKQWQLWDLEHPMVEMRDQPTLTVSGHNDTIYRAAFSPSGQRLATLDYAGKLFVWNPYDGSVLYHQQLPASTGYSLAYAPSGQSLAVATRDQRVMLVTLPPNAH